MRLSNLIKTLDQLSNHRWWRLTDQKCTSQMQILWIWLPKSKPRSSFSIRGKSENLENTLSTWPTLWLSVVASRSLETSSSSSSEVLQPSLVHIPSQLIEEHSIWPSIHQHSTGSLGWVLFLASWYAFKQKVPLEFSLPFWQNTKLLKVDLHLESPWMSGRSQRWGCTCGASGSFPVAMLSSSLSWSSISRVCSTTPLIKWLTSIMQLMSPLLILVPTKLIGTSFPNLLKMLTSMPNITHLLPQPQSLMMIVPLLKTWRTSIVFLIRPRKFDL